jgi:hypothetical protein
MESVLGQALAVEAAHEECMSLANAVNSISTVEIKGPVKASDLFSAWA